MPDSLVIAPRHAPGRGSQVSPAERRDSQLAYLTEKDVTVVSLAERFGRTRETVSGCLKGEDFDALKKQILDDTAKDAKMVFVTLRWAGGGILESGGRQSCRARRPSTIKGPPARDGRNGTAGAKR